MSSVRSRWTLRLHEEEAALNKARRGVDYWSHRTGTSHGVAKLRERKALTATLEHDVALSRRVLARHPERVTGLSAEGLAFIAGREGFSAKPYRDMVGVLTIGYGETQGVKPGLVWTRPYALSQLKLRADRDYGRPVLEAARRAGIELTQHEYDALVSLVYNVGTGMLETGHTLGAAIAAKNRPAIAASFLLYDVAGGRHVLGLTLRRKAEQTMFLTV